MKLHRISNAVVPFAASLFFFLMPSGMLAQAGGGTEAKTIMTAVPKNSEEPLTIPPNDVKVKVDGRSAEVTNVTPLRGDKAGLQLVILIDSGVRASLGRQMSEIADFVRSLPPATEVGIAYMSNGNAIFAQPFTTDKEQALKGLHLPGGTVGSSASPYFCISELAKNWPSHNMEDRREVVTITDGVDPYEVRFDPEDPYVRTAVHDAIRNGVIVDAIYWHNKGFASHVGFIAGGGQSLLTLLTDDTGGKFYYQGLENPVSFQPFFRDLSKRLDNQYELDFMVPAKVKSKIATLRVKLEVPKVKMNAPQLLALPRR